MTKHEAEELRATAERIEGFLNELETMLNAARNTLFNLIADIEGLEEDE